MVKALHDIKSTVPNKKTMQHTVELQDKYKSNTSMFSNGKKRLDPLIHKKINQVRTTPLFPSIL